MNQAIVKDSNAEYHAYGKEVISASGLKMIAKKSVAHYLASAGIKETDAMRLGTAVHAKILEPENYHDEIAVLPELNLRTKDGRLERDQFEEKNQGKTIIRQDDLDTIQGIFESYKAHPLAPRLLNNAKIELSHYGEIQNIPVRCRPDAYIEETGVVIDVKTCQDNSPKAFRRDVFTYGYHIQAAFYCEALKKITGRKFSPLNFRFIAVETNYPYSCEVYSLSEDMIAWGYQAMEKAWDEWKLYKETGVILGYQTEETSADGALIL